MKKLFLVLLFSIGAIAEVKVKELAIRHEGEIVNGKAFLTYGGKQGDVFVVSSGSCTVGGMSVLFHKTSECNGEFARVTCSNGKFETIIQLDQDLLKKLNGKISVSELTGFSPQEGTLCSPAAASIEF
ncbi:MAG: hypothetical protein JNM24_04100 [Bdellovibrionaceae bacterium]|nr:hypothetical protein [Pseudobdellovibrionaceae bacterium]